MRSYRAGGMAARPIGVVMEGFKEFLGKTLDAAIEEACSYYNANREKLEIEIVQDAKTGIFGIVGARKAMIRARRAALREVVENALGRGSRPAPVETDAPSGRQDGETPAMPAEEAAREARPEKSAAAREGSAPRRARGRTEERPQREADSREQRRADERGQKASRKALPARDESQLPARKGQTIPATLQSRPQADDTTAEPAPESTGMRPGPSDAPSRSERPRNAERPAAREAQRECRRSPADDDMDEADESLPRRALEELDQAHLRELARDCVSRLIRPMLSQPAETPEVDIVDGRVRVAVDCGEGSGLLIGREGQTLAALQYLASRIVSRGMDAAVRVQLDAGRYRQRQEEKLRDMALALAAKVRQTGRSYSTRPLSSYHRRIIHLCLQDMDDVLTRSTGDGPLKRVVILRRRPEKGERQPQGEREARRRSRPETGETACPPPVTLCETDGAGDAAPAAEAVMTAAEATTQTPETTLAPPMNDERTRDEA